MSLDTNETSDDPVVRDANEEGKPWDASQLQERLPAFLQSQLWSRVLSDWPAIRILIPVTMFGVALWLLHHELKSIHLADISESFRTVPTWAVLVAIVLTVCNYVVLCGYDLLAVRMIRHPLRLRQVALASFLYYALSNSLGAMFGGTPVRVRLYSAWGLVPQDIVRLIFYIATTFWIGLFTISGILFVVAPFEVPSRFHLFFSSSRPLGAVLLTVVGAYLAFVALRRRPVELFGISIQPPTIPIGVGQIAVASSDFLLAAAVLYVLLPSDAVITFLPFAAIFLLAIFVALVSHVPGGVGVLELVLVTMLPGSSHSLLASVLTYRVIYYLIPLLIAVLIASAALVKQHSRHVKDIGSASWNWTRVVAPRLITAAVFLAGLILLISGALPAAEGRMDWLRRTIPLPIIELSHLLGSIVGAGLLILSHALMRRINAAWWLTMVLLGLGVVVSLAKGADYEEATILGVLFVALLPCRDFFYRHVRILAPSFSATWVGAVVMAVGLVIWITVFSHKHVEYSHELWWQFAFDADAPRSLRALLVAVVALGLAGVAMLLQPRPHLPAIASEQELADVDRIVASATSTSANLALLGDKRFIFSQDRKAFVMFGCQGKSWIAMGDPVGTDASATDAAWRFREACDAAGVWPIFYQVDESSLGRYVEMGLTMLKIGEEARVPLTEFSLEGSARKDLRRTEKKAQESALRFSIVPRTEVPERMPRLKEISDAWLQGKSAAEKGFSLGFFEPTYLARFDVAVIHQSDELIAFANLWRGAQRNELSVDLMRYLPTAPAGVMEYLFTELMLYGHEQGYQWFSLGMAPLSGVEAHRLGSLWNRMSNVLYRHGEHFYNFQGLRNYKGKFHPVWTPKYVATPGGMGLPWMLTDMAALISGGLTKLISK